MTNVQIMGIQEKPLYRLIVNCFIITSFSGECSFYHSTAIIKNGCEIILILLFKLGISVLLKAWIYLENQNGCLFDFRYCNDCLHLFIMINR
jgi:hypothetical protein